MRADDYYVEAADGRVYGPVYAYSGGSAAAALGLDIEPGDIVVTWRSGDGRVETWVRRSDGFYDPIRCHDGDTACKRN